MRDLVRLVWEYKVTPGHHIADRTGLSEKNITVEKAVVGIAIWVLNKEK